MIGKENVDKPVKRGWTIVDAEKIKELGQDRGAGRCNS
jgi:hypothetical protein